MDLILENKIKRTINVKEEFNFSSFSSFHLVIIRARAKGEKQFTPPSTDDEDLTVEIDGKVFPKLGTKNALIDSPASFNGGKLHNLSQTIYFLTFLKGKDHKIILEADKRHSTATLESLEVYTLDLSQRLVLNVGKQAEDGDRRPWLTFVLDNLPLKSFTPDITYHRRFMDSDDVKVISDGKVHISLLRGLKHLFWFFAGSLIPDLSFRTESDEFLVNFSSKLHYLEFPADRRPTFHYLVLDFGVEPTVSKGIPTVEEPKWTEDFYDDTEVMLLARIIFGEARNQSLETKTGVGWSVKNRIGKGRIIDPRKVYNNYHDVILDDGQYASLKDPNVRPRIENPLSTKDPLEIMAWKESYKAASDIISDKVSDPTDGALFFHDDSMTTKDFLIRVPRAVYIKKIGWMVFYGVVT